VNSLARLSAYQKAIVALSSRRSKLSVVQVGANDGAINDPLYPVMKMLVDRTKVLLIEPQKSLLPYLSANYRFHPDATVHNGAVGLDRSLTLYAVKPEIWGELDLRYGKEWPAYRAPTGVTSADRSYVYAWLTKQYRGSRPVDDLIEQLIVPCSSLLPILQAYGWDDEIDVLQIDAEGFDDQVIYNSNIERTKPSIIHFEWKMLNGDKQNALRLHLEGHNFELVEQKGDMLAIRTGS
jgi:FkbM family methyltransferase